MNSCGQNYAAMLIFTNFFDRIQTNAKIIQRFLPQNESELPCSKVWVFLQIK